MITIQQHLNTTFEYGNKIMKKDVVTSFFQPDKNNDDFRLRIICRQIKRIREIIFSYCFNFDFLGYDEKEMRIRYIMKNNDWIKKI